MCGAGAYLVHSAGGRCFHAVIWFCEVFCFDVNPIRAKLDSPPMRPHSAALSLHGVVMDPAPSWTRSRFRCWSSLRTYIFPADVTLAADCLLVGLPACPVRCGAVRCHARRHRAARGRLGTRLMAGCAGSMVVQLRPAVSQQQRRRRSACAGTKGTRSICAGRARLARVVTRRRQCPVPLPASPADCTHIHINYVLRNVRTK